MYITTPIYYVNGRPHLGHAYTTIIADVIARRSRSKGVETFFLTGTDEHGQKIERAARQAGVAVQEYVDTNSTKFQKLWNLMGISYDDFIRTTDDRHMAQVVDLWKTIDKAGYIYKGTYAGFYCNGCEMFTETTVCDTCNRETESSSEENYFFRLSDFQSKILELVESKTLQIEPESSKNEILNVLRSGLKDLSISRSSFTWGIPVPGDPKHVVYVWLDALTNYITAVQGKTDFWPPDIQVMGKEITRFHCIYQIAFLLAAGLELPKKIIAHGWILFGSQGKMSKSIGNTVAVEEVLDDLGSLRPDLSPSERDLFATDVLRYCMLRDIPIGRDGNFSVDGLLVRYNADLANGYGNLVSRVLGLIRQNGLKITHAEESSFDSHLDYLHQVEITMLDTLDFSGFLFTVMKLLSQIDQYLSEKAPWKLYKSKNETDHQTADVVLYECWDALKIINEVLYPIIPFMSYRIGLDLESLNESQPIFFPRSEILKSKQREEITQ